MTNEDAWRIIQTLNAFEEPWRERPDWPGLVYQQALFHRQKLPPWAREELSPGGYRLSPGPT